MSHDGPCTAFINFILQCNLANHAVFLRCRCLKPFCEISSAVAYLLLDIIHRVEKPHTHERPFPTPSAQFHTALSTLRILSKRRFVVSNDVISFPFTDGAEEQQ